MPESPSRYYERLLTVPQLLPPKQLAVALLAPPEIFTAPRLNPSKQSFDEAFAPIRRKYMRAFFYAYEWLGGNVWEDYAQEGIIKLWDMWQREPDMFETHPVSYFIRAGMYSGHHKRSDMRREKHIAFSMNDTPEHFIDNENVYVEMIAYRNQTTNPYRAADFRIDLERAIGQTVASFDSHPNREFIYFMFMRILAGYSIHEAKDDIGMKRKTASNYRYEAFKKLKQNFEYRYSVG